MKLKKVYVLMSGDCSDCGIEGIFDSYDKAEEYIKYNAGYNLGNIKEYNLNELKSDMSEKLFVLRSKFDKIDFEVSEYGSFPMTYKDLMNRGQSFFMCRDPGVYFYISADTKERAIEVASERFRQVKAEDKLRYALLKDPISVEWVGHGSCINTYIHYHTGEVVLPYNSILAPDSIPKDLEPYLKVITMEELEARYKKEKKQKEK